ncbi:MAG: ABC transporter ATP-binding protein [Deltaproteobacteria bacterium]|nr:ABC transporter ATP-binding protein [Deltaproteobacteria bacterium]
MPGIVLKSISKSIRGQKILDNVSMEIEEGSFVCLLGPAGGGKTTLLKIIAGLETPDRGSVFFGNDDVTDLPPNMRNVSMVFQDFALYPHMSVFKNLASPLAAKRLPASQIQKKVEEVAGFLKIDRFLTRKITQLSGGEMQRVAIGRALAKEAKIVLFDEVFVNLDYKLREEMRVEFKKLVGTLNITTVFSTPDPEDALSLADRVAVVNNGKIIQYDEMRKVYEYPVDVFTGSYFGYPEMNLIDCTVTEKDDGRPTIDTGAFAIPIENTEGGSKAIKPGDYVLGLRPENIRIGNKPEGPIAVRGKMILTEVIGSDTIVHIAVGPHTIHAFVPGIYRSASDQDLYVGFEPKDVYLFDREKGTLETRGI